MKICITGSTGTGSSALIDLLNEYSSCTDCGLKRYEQPLLYIRDGLFDLENDLLLNNSAQNSHFAVKKFKKKMKFLNDHYGSWFAGYKFLYDDRFMIIVNNFIERFDYINLNGATIDGFTKYQFSFLTAIKQIYASLKFGEKYSSPLGYQLKSTGEDIFVTYPTKEEFFENSRRFIDDYFQLISNGTEKNVILDHFLFEQNAQNGKLDNYFRDDFRMIVVKRDPRDVYNLNKNIWPKLINCNSGYPEDIGMFCKYFETVNCNDIKNDKLLYVNFEDLIYRYEYTVKEIEKFLNLNSADHVNKFKYFNPEKSIKNTQTYIISEEYQNEAREIASRLNSYLYDFPYINDTRFEDMFD
ncbi:MAG: hypothetical protein RR643_04620 [Anaerorhabdus sp.]|uniref:hypothetical protein n=1 Tax=Anaerorhabdus sp. TaxID=1872524 RepID=UPI002FCCB757